VVGLGAATSASVGGLCWVEESDPLLADGETVGSREAAREG